MFGVGRCSRVAVPEAGAQYVEGEVLSFSPVIHGQQQVQFTGERLVSLNMPHSLFLVMESNSPS